MLILLLPNLSTLKFDYLGDGQECLCSTLSRITEIKDPDAPLSHLRHVQIPHSWQLGCFKLFDSFLSLPSVRAIHGTGMFARDNDACLDIKLPPPDLQSGRLDAHYMLGRFKDPLHLFGNFQSTPRFHL